VSPRAFNERTGIGIGLPMTTASYDEGNPFAVKLEGSTSSTGYILAHQPKSFYWRARGAKPHRARRVPEDSFAEACDALSQIIGIGR
jgi:mRNA interferase MazF